MLAQRIARKRITSATVAPSSPPVWPLPSLDGRTPALISTHAKAPGLELAYEDDDGAEHYMPRHVPAFAVRDGEIMHAGGSAGRHSIVIDHLNGWATYYSNLEHMFATPTDRRQRKPAHVRAGDVLGYVGASGLHFQLWKRDDDGHFVPVDPTSEMTSWLVLPWADERRTPPTSAITQPLAA